MKKNDSLISRKEKLNNWKKEGRLLVKKKKI
jgi:hypothetical protein